MSQVCFKSFSSDPLIKNDKYETGLRTDGINMNKD